MSAGGMNSHYLYMKPSTIPPHLLVYVRVVYSQPVSLSTPPSFIAHIDNNPLMRVPTNSLIAVVILPPLTTAA